jgi:asparagine synthase (glutamine-hydrolysing)
MSRWLAGVFDPGGWSDDARLSASLSPYEATLGGNAGLRVAYSGEPTRERGTLCLLDGQLDNAAELGRELGLGSCTTEGLLTAGYRRWGRELPSRLRGDFVLLVWDPERREGLLARDQLGVRPCLIHRSTGRLLFACEMRHMLALLPKSPTPDPASIAHWVAVSTRPGPQTLYEGIERLQPGSALLFGRDGVQPLRYWAPRFEEPLELAQEELAERIRTSLELAVRRRLATGHGTGVLMSGGLDSSAVAALCAREPGAEALACSATFPEHPQADESELIGELDLAFGLRGVRAEVRPGGLLASAVESIAAWQMPLLGWGDFWTLPLMRASAAAGVTTILDGDGGDELFGVRSFLLADRLRAGHPRDCVALARRLPGAGGQPSRRELARMLGSVALGGATPHPLHGLATRSLVKREAPPWLLRRTARALASSSDPLAWKRLRGPRWWAHAAHGVTQGIEQAGVFEHQRRRAALAGLEARHPLLDLDLVELGLRQPPEQTLDPRFNRPLLRAAMRGLLPDSVRLRPQKARFESLIVDCLRGTDAAAVRRLLTAPDAEIGAYVDRSAMRRSLFDSEERFEADPFRWMWQVWRLVNAEYWLRSLAGTLASAPAGEPRPSPPSVRLSTGGLMLSSAP